MPDLCIISEATGPYNAIGKVAMAQAEAALQGGWNVSVVASFLDESLRDRVQWLKLYVPPRGFAIKWLSGRYFIRKALGGRRFDLIHGHQPQIVDLCDIYQCHFLTRAAYEKRCLEDRSGARWLVEWIQYRLVLHAEDYFYHQPGAARFLFNSQLTRDAFHRFYGSPAREEVFLPPAPKVSDVSQEERQAARLKYGVTNAEQPIVGFLGGLHRRKGFQRVVDALRGQRDLFLLIAGLHSEGYRAPGLEGHSRGVGLVNAHDFYAACDVLVVASHFEPFGLVTLEAASRGIPVIATSEVGALPHLIAAGAGLTWTPGADDLAALVRRAIQQCASLREASIRWAESLSPARHARDLLSLYEKAIAEKSMAGSKSGVTRSQPVPIRSNPSMLN